MATSRSATPLSRPRNLSSFSRNELSVGYERELVTSALAGDPEAFALLAARHRGRVEAVVGRMLPVDDAEEVVQEALLRAFLSLSQLRDLDRFGGWLCGIAVNLAKMRLRRGAVGRRALALAGSGAAVAVDEDRELLELVREAVELLSPGQRDVVLMHYVDDLSCEEIANLLGTTPGAVRVRLHRARASLRRELAPLAPAPLTRLGKDKPMVAMKVADVLVRVAEDDATTPVSDQRIVLLREERGERIVPIWIGSAEGNMLASRLTGFEPPRPMSPDLMVEMLRVTGSRVERVEITALREKTFYATVSIAVDGRTEELDARPSDAMNLAVRVGAPILADEAVVDESSLSGDQLPEELDSRMREADHELQPGTWTSLSAEILGSLRRH
jgi:RNA polymerase sigma factor (sigma-70 family)